MKLSALSFIEDVKKKKIFIGYDAEQEFYWVPTEKIKVLQKIAHKYNLELYETAWFDWGMTGICLLNK